MYVRLGSTAYFHVNTLQLLHRRHWRHSNNPLHNVCKNPQLISEEGAETVLGQLVSRSATLPRHEVKQVRKLFMGLSYTTDCIRELDNAIGARDNYERTLPAGLVDKGGKALGDLIDAIVGGKQIVWLEMLDSKGDRGAQKPLPASYWRLHDVTRPVLVKAMNHSARLLKLC